MKKWDSIVTRFYIFFIIFGLFSLVIIPWSIYKISYNEIKIHLEHRLILEGENLVQQFLDETEHASSKTIYKKFLKKLANEVDGYAFILDKEYSLVLASSPLVKYSWEYVEKHAKVIEKKHPYIKNFEFKSFVINDDPIFKARSVGVIFKIKKKYFLGIVIPHEKAFSPVKIIMQRIIITVILVLFVLFIVSYIIINKNIIFPLKTISKQLQVLEGDDIDDLGVIECSQRGEIAELVKILNKRTSLAKSLYSEIELTQKEIIFTMGSIAESRSKETANHVKRVAKYSYLLAKYYGLDEKEAQMLQEASPMHDIGKVAIPDAILKKPGKLDDAEFQIMQTHAELGYEMLKHSHRELLQTAAIVAYEHHEKWDGSGYPRGLKEKNIHIYGRITAVADVFDALGSNRVYKKAWEDEKIFQLFQEEKGKHFDPELIDIFFLHIKEFLEIRDQLKDI